MIGAAELLRFSVDERIDLVDALWESLDPVVAEKIRAHYATLDPLLQEALRLPRDARIDLAMDLWETISASPDDIPTPDWLVEELDRRLAEADANPDEGIPWEIFREELRERLR
ncbi:MAG: addiction module protein [Gemmatimonadota bacterium]|nr:addiction module protein [Gemmatimonadota bacterium]